MRISWTFIILLVCELFRAAQPENDAKCPSQNVTIIRVSENDNVTVSCPSFPSQEEIMFYLLKDEEVKHNYTCKQVNNCTGIKYHGVELHKSDSSWVFTLRGGPQISGLYRCNSTKTYPPPLERRSGPLVLVKEIPHVSRGPTSNPTDVSTTSPPPREQFPWIWMAAIALVSIYATAVTIIALINWHKFKTESQSDYMNTKPIAPRDRKTGGLRVFRKYF